MTAARHDWVASRFVRTFACRLHGTSGRDSRRKATAHSDSQASARLRPHWTQRSICNAQCVQPSNVVRNIKFKLPALLLARTCKTNNKQLWTNEHGTCRVWLSLFCMDICEVAGVECKNLRRKSASGRVLRRPRRWRCCYLLRRARRTLARESAMRAAG